jgi:photosystem II stability/assembly factor-like uncharacterized protein
MYATAVGPDGGTFRSTDAGYSWERRNEKVQSHWYYGEVFCDPLNADRVYVPVTPLLRSDDGGESFDNAAKSMVHGDHHTLWINPEDSDHLMVGNDGGVYVSRDGGEAWQWISNLPVMQLYTVAVDMQLPFYHVYGGTQDNGTWAGPVGTRFSDGISNEDWRFVSGGDGFYAVADPTDPNIVYSQSQYGVLYRSDRDSGEQRRIQPWQPQDGEFPPYRWNWSAPFQISPHDPETLYFGANVVFRSRDRGTSWERISDDLTRQISRDDLPLQGKVQPADAIDLHASTAMYGNLHALRESPLRRGLLAAGSDDGLIHVSRNGGRSWSRSEAFPGMPEQMKVAMLAWSEQDEGTLFATFDGHKDNLFKPYVVRSDDFGETWRNITGDLPAFGPTRSIAVHPRNSDLVFVGTDFGAFVSLIGGETWLPLQAGLPTNSVQGMVVHPRDNDLVIGTHGRGFWVIDDIGMLEALTSDTVDGHSFVVPPRVATQIRDKNRGRRAFGHSYFTTENPPRGAIINYWIGYDAVGEPVAVDILDDDGELIRRVAEHTAERGIARTVWDLRFEAPPSDSQSSWRKPSGRFVVPGDYEIRVSVGEREHRVPLRVEGDPAVEVSMRDRRRREVVLSEQAKLLTATYHAGNATDAAIEQVSTLLERLRETDAESALLTRAETVAGQAQELRVALEGEARGIAQQETRLPLADLALRLYMTTESWSGAPSPDQSRLTESAREALQPVLDGLQTLLAKELPDLSAKVRSAGIVWPDQRLPEPLDSELVDLSL